MFHTGAVRAVPRSIHPARHQRSKAQAVPLQHVAQLVTQLGEAGDVDAPPYVIFAVAALVTLVGGAIIPLALRPGQEAADQMQDRDSNKWKN